ncbi:MAG TPA: sialidase family protein [Kofleriaceae bacterium]|nr:sialidase family protein [Kofleriaceae bacterium]
MRFVWAGLLAVGFATSAYANGRDPGTSTINFRRDNDQHILAGMTFGLVESRDGGATWQWMCERAVGYGGQYDPDYVYSSTGAIFATTFDGLKVRRNACTFASAPPGMTFVARVKGGPDGAIYYAAADLADAKIYKSTDDGMTFPTSANPGQAGDWWSSLAIAPGNAQRIYLTGYRLDGVNPKIFLLYTSTNGGTSYTAMNMTGITPVSANSTIDVVGISPTSDTTLYVKVTFESGGSGDSIYRSTDAGQSWTKILTRNSLYGLSFLVRTDATTCVAGTRELGAWISTDCSTAASPTWTALAGAPHIGCLYNDSAGTVWACTQNYPSPTIPSDGFGIMKTSDLSAWTGVLRFQDIQAPVSCPAGTVQEDQCVQRYMGNESVWCCLVNQLGITSTAVDCTGALACFGMGPGDGPVDGPVDGAPNVDGAPDGGTTKMKPRDGCCGAGAGRSSLMLGVLVAVVLLRRKRRA